MGGRFEIHRWLHKTDAKHNHRNTNVWQFLFVINSFETYSYKHSLCHLDRNRNSGNISVWLYHPARIHNSGTWDLHFLDYGRHHWSEVISSLIPASAHPHKGSSRRPAPHTPRRLDSWRENAPQPHPRISARSPPANLM